MTILCTAPDKSNRMTLSGNCSCASRKGGLSEQLPLPRGGFCSFSPDGKKMAYNRVFREFRTWKRYRGGQADDIWMYDFETKTTTNLTTTPPKISSPCGSDPKSTSPPTATNNKRMNLFVYDLATRQTTELTQFHGVRCEIPLAGR